MESPSKILARLQDSLDNLRTELDRESESHLDNEAEAGRKLEEESSLVVVLRDCLEAYIRVHEDQGNTLSVPGNEAWAGVYNDACKAVTEARQALKDW